MKLVDIMLGTLFLFGFVFKSLYFFPTINSWGIDIALFLLFLFYLTLSFALFNNLNFKDIYNKRKYQKIKKSNLGASIFGGVVFSFCILSIFLNIHRNNLAELFSLISLISLLCMGGIGLISFIRWPKHRFFYNHIVARMLVIGCFVIITFLNV